MLRYLIPRVTLEWILGESFDDTMYDMEYDTTYDTTYDTRHRIYCS